MRTRVKICGITRARDAADVARLGADALGLVFYQGSPRFVSTAQAVEITATLPPFITAVGLFVNPSAEAVEAVIRQVPLGLLQFHGREPNELCKSFGLPFIKSIPMQQGIDVLSETVAYPDASGFLLDAWQPDTHGGGGETFDWRGIPAQLPAPFILAGGLSPDNITAAVTTVRPYAVDVSSGVESEKGIKSADKIAAFIEGVRHGDTSHGT